MIVPSTSGEKEDRALRTYSETTSRVGSRRTVLLFAPLPDATTGITGATQGTSIVAEQLRTEFRVIKVRVRRGDFSSSADQGPMAKALRHVRAIVASTENYISLALASLSYQKIDYVYFVPSSSLNGRSRDVITILLFFVLFRHARIIAHLRNGDHFENKGHLSNALRNLVLRRCDRIFLLSKRLIPPNDILSSELLRKFLILPNTIDVDLIPGNPLPEHNNEQRINVLYFSNFIPDKGYEILLKAVELLIERGTAENFSFAFYGRWISISQREAFIHRTLNVVKRGIRIHVGDEVICRQRSQEIYSMHDIFCLPTKYHAEAQPRSIIEAMANYCAILATNYRAIPDMVEEGENGFLIDEADPFHLADKLEMFLKQDKIKMQRRSREIFEARFSAYHHQKILMEAFR